MASLSASISVSSISSDRFICGILCPSRDFNGDVGGPWAALEAFLPRGEDAGGGNVVVARLHIHFERPAVGKYFSSVGHCASSGVKLSISTLCPSRPTR